MGKYEALGQFLSSQGKAVVPMTFEQIERVIGDSLPPSRRYPAWWSNNPSNNPMTKVWLDAGFTTERVDVEGHKVVFRRLGEEKSHKSGNKGQHPLIGCMAGTVTIAPGVDISQADPEWADYLDEVYGPESK